MHNATELAQLIADAGLVLLRNGAETYRTSETMEYMAYSLQIKSVDLFVLPSTVMVSIQTGDGENATVIRRVTRRTINLDRVVRINQLSREMAAEKKSYSEARHLIDVIRRERTGFSVLPSIGFAGLVAVGFAVMQNGNGAECIASFVAGALVRFVAHLVSKVEQSRILFEFLGAICAALVGIVAHNLFESVQRDVVIVGGIMPLVPGVAITNSIRDIINGDNLSGIIRGIEAALSSIAIAMGILLILSINL